MTQPYHLVDPDGYEALIHEALHSVVDRVVELGSKADHFDSDDLVDSATKEGDESSQAAEVLRTQMAMPPSERSELRLASTLLNVLLSTAIVRRAGLYEVTEEEE